MASQILRVIRAGAGASGAMVKNWSSAFAGNWTFLVDQHSGRFQAGSGAMPMYVPPAFREHDLAALHGTIRDARLASLVTATAEGLEDPAGVAADQAVAALIPA